MIINLKAICGSIDMSQAEFARLSGLSRYTIWKATEPAYKGDVLVSADRFYEIHKRIPGFLPLPEDFFNYTRPIVMINKYQYNLKNNGVFQHIAARLNSSDYYFFYSYKDMIDEVFPNMFLPYIIDSDHNTIPYHGTDFIPFSKRDPDSIYLHSPVTWEKYKDSPDADRGTYDRYSAGNLRANLFFRNLSRKDFLSMVSSRIQRFLNMDVSFVRDKEVLEELFEPYITVKRTNSE